MLTRDPFGKEIIPNGSMVPAIRGSVFLVGETRPHRFCSDAAGS
jgi:hypothetical protein